MKWFEDARRSQFAEVFVMSEETVVDERPIAGIGTLVFGKWDAAEVVATIQVLHLMLTSQLLVYHTPVADTPTCGLESPNSVLLSATSTNSCEPVPTLERSNPP